MDNHFLKKMGKNRKYRDLDVKRDVSGQVLFENVSSGVITQTGLTTTGTFSAGLHEGPIQAYKFNLSVTSTAGTPSMKVKPLIDGSTIGTTLTGTTTGDTISKSSMTDLLNPSFTLSLSSVVATGTLGLKATVQKEQNIG